LRELGWVEGQNLLIEQRYGSAELLPRMAEEFVRLNVDLIVADGTAATLAAKNATTTIPILMWSAGDPVGAGLVASLPRRAWGLTNSYSACSLFWCCFAIVRSFRSCMR
jgi:putative ABC transport system substrate-binding protein